MINRKEFIDKFSEKGYTKRDSAVIMDDFINTIREILVSGESVMFRGFGTFYVLEHSGKDILNPQTKERMTIEAFKSPKFLAGKLLKREVKEGFIRE